VQFSGRRFTWTFLLEKVEFPILGADFLKHFNLIVDLGASQLLATDTLQWFAAGPPPQLRRCEGDFSQQWSPSRPLQGRLQRVPRRGQLQRLSPSSQALDAAPHQHHGAAGDSALPPPGRGKVGGRQGQVQQVREVWYHPAIFQQLVGPAAHGDEARWVMVALWRLLPPESGHHS